MQFALTPDQNLLKDAVDAFVRDHSGIEQRRADRSEPRGYGDRNWRSLADIGVLSLPFAVEDGGLGGGERELITVMESLGRGLCVEPVLEEVVLAGGVLARAGTAAQKAAWLPRLMAGEAHLALAHFETSARFDISGVEVRVRGSNGGRVLEGEKSVVPLGELADGWIVSAREAGRDDADAVGLFLVSAQSPGVERSDFRLIDGSRASALRLRGAPAGERLRGGLPELAATFDGGRLAACAEMVGIMSTLFESTVEYLKTRQQFGRTLSSFQALQHRLADLYVRLEQSRSHLYRASADPTPASIAGMKSYVSRAAVEIGEECVHLHGGIGTTDELAIGHGYKRLILLANLFGDAHSELMRFNQIRNAALASAPAG